jgi:hypothetical protein
MQFSRNKTAAILIAAFLMFSMTASMVLIPSSSEHTPPWKITTYPYLSAVPNKVGLGQSVFIVMWAYLKMPNSAINNVIRMQNYRLNITTPNGTVVPLGPFTPDPTETTYTTYTPDAVGNYSIVFSYPDTTYVWTGGANDTWANDVFLGATSSPQYFTVQDQPVPVEINSYPLPNEYWNYPIEAQNTFWYSISSNWLGTGSPQIGSELFQQDGTAPNSAHVLWTKPIQAGGIVGGSSVGIPGNQFYTGQSYNQRFPNPIILEGNLYYREPAGISGQAGATVCVNLRTGQEVWRRSDLPTLSFAMTYDLETPNQQGVIYNGILFSSNFAQAFDPLTGNSLFNVTGVPSGTQVLGPDGSILRYVFTNQGNISNPNWYFSEWNSSNLWNNAGTTPTIAASVNAAASNMFDWNVSVPWRNGMTGTIAALNANTNITTPSSTSPGPDVLIGINGTTSLFDVGYTIFGGANNGTATPYTIWAVSTDAKTPGKLNWMTTYTAPSGANDTGVIVWPETIDFQTSVFTVYEAQTMNLYGYSIDNGTQLWGPVTDPLAFDSFTGSVNTENTGSHHVAYGNLYKSGYGGVLFCYDDITGKLKWSYGNGEEGNSTVPGLGTPWSNLPLFIAGIADGKVYVFNDEHSPTLPLYKGAMVSAIDAYNGTQLWSIMSWGDGGSFVGTCGAIAAGEWVYDNIYDMQIYAIGQGPTVTTVTAPNTASTVGTPAVIRGTVMDISAGTQQEQQKANFPAGVPAMSDASQADWMSYIYMQKPLPTNATGVQVSLSVIDSNRNNRPIGTTTTDSSGMFTYSWSPDIAGNYTITATFAGTQSYYGSTSETSFYAIAPSPTATPPPATPTSVADMYFVPAIAGLFVLVIVVLVLVVIGMFRKRP